MMHRGTWVAAILAVVLLPLGVSAQPTETGETGLIAVPNTRTIPPGMFSIGYDYRRDVESNKRFETFVLEGAGGLRDTDLTQHALLVGVGILPGIELTARFAYVDFQIDQPTENNDFQETPPVRVTPKFRIFQEDQSAMPFGLAVLTSVAIPTETDDLPATLDRNTMYNDDFAGEVMGIVDKNLFDLPGDVPVVLSLNAGALFPGKPDTFKLTNQTENVFAQLRRKGNPITHFETTVFQYGAGLELPLWKNHIGKLDWLTEFRGNTGTIEEIDDYRAILGGIRYMLVNGWEAHAAGDVGLSNTVERVNFLAGISYTGPQPPVPPPGYRERIVYKDRVIQVERVTFSDITFEFDKATLTDVGRGRVYLIAQKLKEGKNVKIEIQGHTDYIGTEDYNKSLGLRRAETIKAELVRLGVDPAHMSTVSFGEAKPLIDEKTPWARAVNRRVEFVVVSEGEATTGQASPPSQPAE